MSLRGCSHLLRVLCLALVLGAAGTAALTERAQAAAGPAPFLRIVLMEDVLLASDPSTLKRLTGYLRAMSDAEAVAVVRFGGMDGPIYIKEPWREMMSPERIHTALFAQASATSHPRINNGLYGVGRVLDWHSD
jgi:hypothetical protein